MAAGSDILTLTTTIITIRKISIYSTMSQRSAEDQPSILACERLFGHLKIQKKLFFSYYTKARLYREEK